MSASGGRTDVGRGYTPTVQAVAQPAAGQNFSIIPVGTAQLVAVTATLVTSATAGNRLPQLQVADASLHTLVNLPSSSVQAPSLTETYTWALGMPFASGNNLNLIPLPSGLVVPPTWSVIMSMPAIAAGDQWSSIVATWAG